MNTQKITSEEIAEFLDKEKVEDVNITHLAPTEPVRRSSQIVELATTPEKIVKQVQLFDELKRKLLSDKDYQEIAGKRFIKKSGWRMFALAFNLSDKLLKEERKQYTVNKSEYFAWEATVQVVAPNGRYAEATASCASNEKKFSHPEHDVRATAHTRAKNRAIADLIGGGEVSAEEMDSDSVTRNTQASAGASQDDIPATPKQLGYIKNLAKEKGIETGIADAVGVELKDPEKRSITKKEADLIIQKLMSL